MNAFQAATYAARVYRGQSPDLPMGTRVRRVQSALNGQGLKIRDAEIHGIGQEERCEWIDAVGSVCLQDALSAWMKETTPSRRVRSVEIALAMSGFELHDVLAASKLYWARKQRDAKARGGMTTREEAARFICKQLHDDDFKCSRDKRHRHHYGVQELRELMDFIYGGEPKTESEKIVSVDGHKNPLY